MSPYYRFFSTWTVLVGFAIFLSAQPVQIPSVQTTKPAQSAKPATTAGKVSFPKNPANPETVEAVQRLPIRRMVLYRNGVGLLERRGWVSGNVEIHIPVKDYQVQDVLRSLLVLDLGKGHIGAVSCDRPVLPAVELKEIPFFMPAEAESESPLVGFVGIFRQLQGVRVAVQTKKNTLTGTVLTVERRILKLKEETRVVNYLVLTGTDEGIISIEFNEIEAVKILDEQARQDVERFTRMISIVRRTNTGQDERTVVVASNGQGNRELVISYLAAVPIWRTSYRLVLDSFGKPFLQGWALVENPTDEDWTDVNISLMSGQPHTQIQPLPTLKRAENKPQTPQYKLDGMENDSRIYGSGLFTTEKWTTVSDVIASGGSGVETATATAEVGDLYEYHVDQPVTVGRHRTALVPVIQSPLEGERISLVTATTAGHPESGLRLGNASKILLENGTAAVYEGDSFAGEGDFPMFKPDEKHFLIFGVDPSTMVFSINKESNEPAYLAKAEEGEFKVHYFQSEQRIYTIQNPSKKVRIIYVRHPSKGKSWSLMEDVARPVDQKKGEGYLFRLEIAPDEKREFVVTERGPMEDTYKISTIGPEEIAFFASKGYLDDVTQKALENIVVIKRQIHKLGIQLAEIESEREKLTDEREKLQDGIKTVGNNSEVKPLIALYVKKLETIEARLDQLEQDQKAAITDRTKAESDLEKASVAIKWEKKLTPMPK